MNSVRPFGSAVMDLVAGPQGSGKSTFFIVHQRGFDSFNIDDHRKKLNGGSSHDIPPDIRKQAIQNYEVFVATHIDEGKSFSIEVTLAREVTFQQAEQAQKAGFLVRLTYVGAEVDECIQRVASRVEMGGHGVTETVLRETHDRSTKNLPRAIREFDVVQVYDNARQARPGDTAEEIKPRLVLKARRAEVTYVDSRHSAWLRTALAGTEFALA